MDFYLLVDNLFIREGIRSILTVKYPHSDIHVLSDIEQLNLEDTVQSSIFISNDPLVFYNFQPKISNLLQKKELKTVFLANASQLEQLKTKDQSMLHAIIFSNCSLADLDEALGYIQSGLTYRCRKLTMDGNCSSDFDSFLDSQSISLREREIIRLVIDGLNSKEIAEKLFISYNTVTTHRKNINKKLGLKGPNDLMRLSISGPTKISSDTNKK